MRINRWILPLTLLAHLTPAMAAPTPDYDVIETSGATEIRAYPALAAAEVTVEGDREAAADDAFRILFAYISGANTSKENISMTAPVTQEKGVTIAMTAPVTQEALEGAWIVRFILPADLTAETAPAPTDARVRIVTLPPERVAAIRFSGYANNRSFAENEAKLRTYVAGKGLTHKEPPVYAIYNGPFTLGPWRRNEVILRLSQ